MTDSAALPTTWPTRVELLLNSAHDLPPLFAALRNEQTHLAGRDLLISRSVLRLALAAHALPPTARPTAQPSGPADVAVLLRQVIRLIGPCQLPATLWQRLRPHAEGAHLIGEHDPELGAGVRVMAQPWHSAWLPHSAAIDALEARDATPACAADGMLYAMSADRGTPWSTYRSAAQKAAVDLWLYAPPGSTTLVTLPTGSGKSICTLLPPWFESRGGRRYRETTLVVVPTVALALDQEQQAARFFRHARDEYTRPIARTGDTSQEERQAIERGLRDGSLPAIITSPESLLGSRLYDVILQAARDKLITRLVIDEAHLVEAWGMGFRPEFQLLAGYRRRLLEASGGQLRTLLLSATITWRSRETLEDLFADPDPLIVAQANRLRAEPSYWFDLSRSEATRRSHVLEALRHLPRPLILYVTRPDQAQYWARRLREQGYARLEVFHGLTPGDERRRILQRWRDNEIDLVIGTSAFGLGVDKEDVRSVVHATIPENIDRYYQEVGRSGRDGYSSVSLVCATAGGSDSDIDLAYGLTPKLITLEKALPRWQGLHATARSVDGLYWLDRDARPAGRDDMAPGERNRDWNDHLLLLMQRAGLIEIVDAPPPIYADDGQVTNQLAVRILQPAIFNAPAQTLATLEPQREREKIRAVDATRGIVELVTTHAQGKADSCLATTFAALYADVQSACGGCPHCRDHGSPPYAEPLRFSLEGPATYGRAAVSDTDAQIDPALDALLGAWRTLNLTWQGRAMLQEMVPVTELLPTLVNAGFVQVIAPDALLEDAALHTSLVAALGTPDPNTTLRRHRLLPATWIVAQGYPLLPLPTVLLYPCDDRAAAHLHQKATQLWARGARAPVIHIVHEQLRLAPGNRLFTDQVDGITLPWTALRDRLARPAAEISFF